MKISENKIINNNDIYKKLEEIYSISDTLFALSCRIGIKARDLSSEVDKIILKNKEVKKCSRLRKKN